MRNLGTGMKNRFFGPISPCDFLKQFLPKAVIALPWSDEAKERLHAVATANNGDGAMFDSMIRALEPFCPTVDLFEMQSHPDSFGMDPQLPNPGICSYPRPSDTSEEPGDMLKFEHVFHFTHDDGFGDEACLELSTPDAERIRRQLSAYATIQFTAQHRTHTFSILITKHHARLIRWDRAGAIVTSKFPFAEEPYLAEFLWAYVHANPEQRGWDTSVTDISTLTELSGRETFLRDEARRILDIPLDEPVFRFTVWDNDDTGELSYYYGHKPLFTNNHSSAGRCTCGYIVIDENAKLAFLKDTWRIISPDWIREGVTYLKLRDARVRNVPTVLASGDIPGQQTHSYGPLQKHYRIVFREVASEITTYGDTSELVSVVRDAVQAHQDAFEKAGILHRDISTGNILITSEGKGLLIDWEFSEHLDEVANGRQTVSWDRNGTWAFMSARLLQAQVVPGQPIRHTLQDDLESFYHVLSWILLQHEPHHLSHTVKLQEIIAHTYNYAVTVDGYRQGGMVKRLALLASVSDAEEIYFDGPMKDLIIDLQRALRVRYMKTPTEAQRQQYKSLKKRCPGEFLQICAAWEYDTTLTRIQDSTWMVQRLDEAVSALRNMEAASDAVEFAQDMQ